MGAEKNAAANRSAERKARNKITGSGTQDNGVILEQNAAVIKWIPKVKNALRSSARWFTDGKTESMVIRDHGKQLEKKLAKSIESKFRKEFSVINNVSFQFERHGVFVHKGVGRGYESNGKGFVVRTAKNPARKNERTAVEWFNPVLDKNIPQLADKIAAINADASVNASRIRIS